MQPEWSIFGPPCVGRFCVVSNTSVALWGPFTDCFRTSAQMVASAKPWKMKIEPPVQQASRTFPPPCSLFPAFSSRLNHGIGRYHYNMAGRPVPLFSIALLHQPHHHALSLRWTQRRRLCCYVGFQFLLSILLAFRFWLAAWNCLAQKLLSPAFDRFDSPILSKRPSSSSKSWNLLDTPYFCAFGRRVRKSHFSILKSSYLSTFRTAINT